MKEMKDVEDVIMRSTVCRLGMCDRDGPYVVPMNFGYRDRTVYMHSAPAGRKIEALKRNPRVCIEFDIDHELVASGAACGWGMRYRSVIAFGNASIIATGAELWKGLEVLMSKYSDAGWEFPEDRLDSVCVIKVGIETMSGKKSGY